MKVVLACKRTAYESFTQRYGDHWPEALDGFDLESRAVLDEHEEHMRSVDALVAELTAVGLEPEVFLARSYGPGDLEGSDLVISVGGDGELLNVASYLQGGELVLGFKSYRRSAGRLLLDPRVTPRKIARALVRGAVRVEHWTRVAATIYDRGRVTHGLALNEVFIGDEYSMGTARYTIQVGRRRERQRSSGIVVATGAGSTGWYSNIVVPTDRGCHLAMPFDRRSRQLRYLVRDPIRYPEPPKLVAGTILPGTSFVVKSTMNTDGVVSFDGSKPTYERPRAYPFNRGARVEIGISDHPLRVAVPSVDA